MTPHERAQLLFMLRAYLIGQRARSPNRFADGRVLLQITNLLWIAYWETIGFDWLDDEDDDTAAEVADFHRWLLTLWPTVPAA